MQIPVNEIQVKEGRRGADADIVRGLADSIREVGLLNPLTVDGGHVLIAGLHRLEAVKLLGWAEVECTISSLEGLQAELAEIDENIVRSGLPAVEYGEILLRRKEIYEALHPEAKHGGDRKSGEIKTKKFRFDLVKSFAQDTAEKLGVVPRTVELQIQTAKNLTPEAREIIKEADTKITKKTAMKLSRLEPEQQKEAAAKLAAKEIRSVDEYKAGLEKNAAGKCRAGMEKNTAGVHKAVQKNTGTGADIPEKAKNSAAGRTGRNGKPVQRAASDLDYQEIATVSDYQETAPDSDYQESVPVSDYQETIPVSGHQKAIPDSDYREPGSVSGYRETAAGPDAHAAATFPKKSGRRLQDVVAELKDPDKDCSGTPDSFLEEYAAFVKKFHKEIEWYCNPYYDAVFPLLSTVQFAYFRKQTDAICSAAESLYKKVERIVKK